MEYSLNALRNRLLPRGIRALPLTVAFIFVFLSLTIFSAAASIPQKGTVIIGVNNRQYNRLDNVTISILDNSTGTVLETKDTVNGLADFFLQKGTYKIIAIKDNKTLPLKPQYFKLTDTTRVERVIASVEIFFLTVRVLDSVGFDDIYKSAQRHSAYTVLPDDELKHRFLDNSTVRVELTQIIDQDNHTVGISRELPFRYLIQRDGAIRTSWFYEYGIKKADAFKIIDPLTGLPLKDQSRLGGEWARRYTYEGYFYYPDGLEKGTYKIKIWDGCHLIGKYEISINNDVQSTVAVPYEKQESVNFQNYLLNEINEAKEELNPDRLNELENYITDHDNSLPDPEGMSQYIQSIEGFVLQSLSGGKISDITVSGDFPNSIVTTNGTLLDSKSFDGSASASVYAPSGVKTLTQYHLPARSTVQSVQNSLPDYTWDYNPDSGLLSVYTMHHSTSIQNITYTPPLNATLGVTVVNPLNQTMPGIPVTIYDDQNQTLATTITDDVGYVAFNLPKNQWYTIWVSGACNPTQIWLDKDTAITVDPASTVATTTNTYATRYPTQRKSFYANGRFWVFWSDGTNMVYSTSTDGSTWSASTSIRACTDGEQFSVFFDGTYFHYAYSPETAGSAIYYGRGTPNADGTVTWSAIEQTAVAGASGVYYYMPNIAVDSDGYPWIGYRRKDATTEIPYITKASTNDGTWTTASDFPYNFGGGYTDSNSWTITPIPLTSSKVYVLYARSSTTIKGKLYTGTWGSRETASGTNIYNGKYYSAVADGDDVHLVYLDTNYNIKHRKRTYGSGWGAGVSVQTECTNTSAPVLSINTANHKLYCFWAGSPTADHIYYKKYVSGTWDASPTDWITETTDLLTDYNSLICFYKAYNDYIGLVYPTKLASPFNVRFNFVPLAALNTTFYNQSGLEDASGAGTNADPWWSNSGGSVTYMVKLYWDNNTLCVTNGYVRYEYNGTLGTEVRDGADGTIDGIITFTLTFTNVKYDLVFYGTRANQTLNGGNEVTRSEANHTRTIVWTNVAWDETVTLSGYDSYDAGGYWADNSDKLALAYTVNYTYGNRPPISSGVTVRRVENKTRVDDTNYKSGETFANTNKHYIEDFQITAVPHGLTIPLINQTYNCTWTSIELKLTNAGVSGYDQLGGNRFWADNNDLFTFNYTVTYGYNGATVVDSGPSAYTVGREVNNTAADPDFLPTDTFGYTNERYDVEIGITSMPHGLDTRPANVTKDITWTGISWETIMVNGYDQLDAGRYWCYNGNNIDIVYRLKYGYNNATVTDSGSSAYRIGREVNNTSADTNYLSGEAFTYTNVRYSVEIGVTSMPRNLDTKPANQTYDITWTSVLWDTQSYQGFITYETETNRYRVDNNQNVQFIWNLKYGYNNATVTDVTPIVTRYHDDISDGPYTSGTQFTHTNQRYIIKFAVTTVPHSLTAPSSLTYDTNWTSIAWETVTVSGGPSLNVTNSEDISMSYDASTQTLSITVADTAPAGLYVANVDTTGFGEPETVSEEGIQFTERFNFAELVNCSYYYDAAAEKLWIKYFSHSPETITIRWPSASPSVLPVMKVRSPPYIQWVTIILGQITDLGKIEEGETIRFNEGEYDVLSLFVSVKEPSSLATNAYAILTTPNGTRRIYQMVLNSTSGIYQTFSVAFATANLPAGNYSLTISIENSVGRTDTYGPILIEVSRLQLPSSPIFIVRVDMLYVVGGSSFITGLALAVWYTFYRRRRVPLVPMSPPKPAPPAPPSMPSTVPAPELVRLPPPVAPGTRGLRLRSAALSRVRLEAGLIEIPKVEELPPEIWKVEPRAVKLRKASLPALKEVFIRLEKIRVAPPERELRVVKLRKAALKMRRKSEKPEDDYTKKVE